MIDSDISTIPTLCECDPVSAGTLPQLISK